MRGDYSTAAPRSLKLIPSTFFADLQVFGATVAEAISDSDRSADCALAD